MDRFEPVGGRLALDFVNTVGWRDSGSPEERLETVADVRDWTRSVGLSVGRGKVRPVFGEGDLARLRSAREALHRLFLSFASGRRPRPADLTALNRLLESAPARRRLTVSGARILWDESESERTLEGGPATSADFILWRVARSAAELLTEDPPEAVKSCEGKGCGWLFLDTSRTRARRWCSMSDCGNRAKARRHYERKKRARR